MLDLDDILDMNESLDVWVDMNDLDKTSPAKPHGDGDGVIRVSRDSAIGSMFG